MVTLLPKVRGEAQIAHRSSNKAEAATRLKSMPIAVLDKGAPPKGIGTRPHAERVRQWKEKKARFGGGEMLPVVDVLKGRYACVALPLHTPGLGLAIVGLSSPPLSRVSRRPLLFSGCHGPMHGLVSPQQQRAGCFSGSAGTPQVHIRQVVSSSGGCCWRGGDRLCARAQTIREVEGKADAKKLCEGLF